MQDTASADTVPDLTARLGETERRIGRLIEALAAGPDDLPPFVRSWLDSSVSAPASPSILPTLGLGLGASPQ